MDQSDLDSMSIEDWLEQRWMSRFANIIRSFGWESVDAVRSAELDVVSGVVSSFDKPGHRMKMRLLIQQIRGLDNMPPLLHYNNFNNDYDPNLVDNQQQQLVKTVPSNNPTLNSTFNHSSSSSSSSAAPTAASSSESASSTRRSSVALSASNLADNVSLQHAAATALTGKRASIVAINNEANNQTTNVVVVVGELTQQLNYHDEQQQGSVQQRQQKARDSDEDEDDDSDIDPVDSDDEMPSKSMFDHDELLQQQRYIDDVEAQRLQQSFRASRIDNDDEVRTKETVSVTRSTLSHSYLVRPTAPLPTPPSHNLLQHHHHHRHDFHSQQLQPQLLPSVTTPPPQHDDDPQHAPSTHSHHPGHDDDNDENGDGGEEGVDPTLANRRTSSASSVSSSSSASSTSSIPPSTANLGPSVRHNDNDHEDDNDDVDSDAEHKENKNNNDAAADDQSLQQYHAQQHEQHDDGHDATTTARSSSLPPPPLDSTHEREQHEPVQQNDMENEEEQIPRRSIDIPTFIPSPPTSSDDEEDDDDDRTQPQQPHVEPQQQQQPAQQTLQQQMRHDDSGSETGSTPRDAGGVGISKQLSEDEEDDMMGEDNELPPPLPDEVIETIHRLSLSAPPTTTTTTTTAATSKPIPNSIALPSSPTQTVSTTASSTAAPTTTTTSTPTRSNVTTKGFPFSAASSSSASSTTPTALAASSTRSPSSSVSSSSPAAPVLSLQERIAQLSKKNHVPTPSAPVSSAVVVPPTTSIRSRLAALADSTSTASKALSPPSLRHERTASFQRKQNQLAITLGLQIQATGAVMGAALPTSRAFKPAEDNNNNTNNANDAAAAPAPSHSSASSPSPSSSSNTLEEDFDYEYELPPLSALDTDFQKTGHLEKRMGPSHSAHSPSGLSPLSDSHAITASFKKCYFLLKDDCLLWLRSKSESKLDGAVFLGDPTLRLELDEAGSGAISKSGAVMPELIVWTSRLTFSLRPSNPADVEELMIWYGKLRMAKVTFKGKLHSTVIKLLLKHNAHDNTNSEIRLPPQQLPRQQQQQTASQQQSSYPQQEQASSPSHATPHVLKAIEANSSSEAYAQLQAAKMIGNAFKKALNPHAIDDDHVHDQPNLNSPPSQQSQYQSSYQQQQQQPSPQQYSPQQQQRQYSPQHQAGQLQNKSSYSTAMPAQLSATPSSPSSKASSLTSSASSSSSLTGSSSSISGGGRVEVDVARLSNQLKTGAIFLKYKHKKGQKRCIWCPSSLDRILWGDEKKKSVKGYLMVHDILSIEPTASTAKRPNLGITLVAPHRTLELECDNETMKKVWIEAFSWIVNAKNE